MKSIYITRNITLQREGQDDAVLQKGHHTVADDVAEHPFVKHHTSSVEDAGAGTADLQALLDQTRIAASSEIEQLQTLLVAAQDDAAAAPELRKAVAHHADRAEQLQRDLNAAQASFDARYDAKAVELAAAQATIAERDAALAAYAAMTPAEPKGKAK